MKKIILGLFLMLGAVSFSAPKYVNTTKLENAGYEITVRIREKDIINLKVGLNAKLKLPAFANTIQCMNATVKKISADSLSNGRELFYLVTLVPDLIDNSNSGKKNIVNNSLQLKSGMIANAKIIVSEQRIISYLMKKMEIQL